MASPTNIPAFGAKKTRSVITKIMGRTETFCPRISIYIHIRRCIHNIYKYTYIVNMRIHTSVHYIHTHIHIHTHTRIQLLYIHIHIHYIYTYTYTIYTHTHTFLEKKALENADEDEDEDGKGEAEGVVDVL